MTIHINFNLYAPFELEDEYDFVTDFYGKILDSGSEDEGDNTQETFVGTVSGYRVYMGLIHEYRRNPWHIFDDHSQALSDFYEVLFDRRTGELKESLCELSLGPDILIIDKVEIMPNYRGKMIGLRAVRRTLEFLGGGCAIAALHAHPIEYDPKDHKDWIQKMRIEAFTDDKMHAEKKLRRYWSRLGFKRIPKTSYMAFAMTQQIPNV